ncbi:MAG: hypothetical protein AAFO99_14530 [Bacteroidota bacterium]
MKKHLIPTCLLLPLCIIWLVSCDGDNATQVQEIEVRVLVASDMKAHKKRITQDMQALFWFIENEKCRDTAFIPRISIARLDLNKKREDSLKISLSAINKFKKSMGTLRPIHILADYKESLAKLTLPEFVFMPSEKNPSDLAVALKNYAVDYRYALDSLVGGDDQLFYSIKSIREDIARDICTFKKSTFTISYGFPHGERQPIAQPDSLILLPPYDDPCKTNTVPKAMALKEAMLEVTNAAKSDNERLKIADRVWDTYFSKNAYINRYTDTSGSTLVGYFEPGQGKAYFTSRIALIASITDINIFRIEFSTRAGEEHKISGIHLAECHNASEMVREN